MKTRNELSPFNPLSLNVLTDEILQKMFFNEKFIELFYALPQFNMVDKKFSKLYKQIIFLKIPDIIFHIMDYPEHAETCFQFVQRYVPETWLHFDENKWDAIRTQYFPLDNELLKLRLKLSPLQEMKNQGKNLSPQQITTLDEGFAQLKKIYSKHAECAGAIETLAWKFIFAAESSPDIKNINDKILEEVILWICKMVMTNGAQHYFQFIKPAQITKLTMSLSAMLCAIRNQPEKIADFIPPVPNIIHRIYFNFSGIALAMQNLANKMLIGAKFENAYLAYLDLSESILQYANFHSANFDTVNTFNADFCFAKLDECKFSIMAQDTHVLPADTNFNNVDYINFIEDQVDPQQNSAPLDVYVNKFTQTTPKISLPTLQDLFKNPVSYIPEKPEIKHEQITPKLQTVSKRNKLFPTMEEIPKTIKPVIIPTKISITTEPAPITTAKTATAQEANQAIKTPYIQNNVFEANPIKIPLLIRSEIEEKNKMWASFCCTIV